MEKLNKGLIDFEDTIRLDALTLTEAIEYKINCTKDIFVVGADISKYVHYLRKLQFKDMWQITAEPVNGEYIECLRKIVRKTRPDHSASMFAYIDYVMEKTQADLMIFLPNKSGILAFGEQIGSNTYDEITRTLQKFHTRSERVHFVTGLFHQRPKEFEELANKIRSSFVER